MPSQDHSPQRNPRRTHTQARGMSECLPDHRTFRRSLWGNTRMNHCRCRRCLPLGRSYRPPSRMCLARVRGRLQVSQHRRFVPRGIGRRSHRSYGHLKQYPHSDRHTRLTPPGRSSVAVDLRPGPNTRWNSNSRVRDRLCQPNRTFAHRPSHVFQPDQSHQQRASPRRAVDC